MKLKKIYVIIICILFPSLNIFANEYAINNIPDSLKTDAYAVVRNLSATFTQKNKNEGLYKETKVITVLSAKGDDFADFSYTGDKFRELTSFSGIIRNASGEIIKKIKKGDLTSSNIDLDMNTLITEHSSLFYEYKSPNYPFTVEYTYEEKRKNGMISYPPFAPMDWYNESVEKANYTIEIPKDYELRHKSNYDHNLEKLESLTSEIYNISVSNLKAIQREAFAPSDFKEVFPINLFAPSDFCYDSFCGNMSDWKNYGLWLTGLQKDRDTLPAEFIEKIKLMTKDAKDEREKVKILYEYLQNNTRYVNISLGIGGYRSMEASSVYKTGFGDCKALSNYMGAMLKAIDIPSHYCPISTKEKVLFSSFPNFNQANHVILLVPLTNDSIWLECTSQTLPFGYVHQSIAGHDALVVSDDGGKLHRLPSYTDKQNLKESKLTLNISEDGNANGKIEFSDHVFRYENWEGKLKTLNRDLNLKYLNSNIKFPKVQYGEIAIANNKSDLPSSNIKASFEASDYANKTGNRLFIPLCPLSKISSGLFTSSTRKADILFETGFSDKDTIVFNIPETYIPESLPKNIKLDTPYGSFETIIKQEGNQITYTQDIDVYSGRYSSSEYKEIKDFFSQISTAVKRKLVIKKQENAL